ncbi:transporter [Methylobacterium sp. sgz302541]|uniref:transporter n=1 Tax=unclassified Methylobacterium TaxID=2615210 RepID=UPI003D356295
MQAWAYTLIPAETTVVGAAGEILPNLKHAGSAGAILIGGAVGVAAMLGVRMLERRGKGPVGLTTVTGIDILVDGLVLGIAFATGAKAGILLTVALTVEVLFLGLTVANELGEGGASKRRVIATTTGLVLLLPLGALLRGPIGKLPLAVPGGFLAFGLIALLYLVTEELLVEAHVTEDRPWVTAVFFTGFLLLLLLDEMVG